MLSTVIVLIGIPLFLIFKMFSTIKAEQKTLSANDNSDSTKILNNETILFEELEDDCNDEDSIKEPSIKNSMNNENRQQMSELVYMPLFINEGSIQKMVKSTVSLERPTTKVCVVKAKAEVMNKFIITNKVTIQGKLEKQIFYVCDDSVVRHQKESIPFSYYIDIPGAEPGMNADITVEVEHIDYNLLDSTTLHQEVILSFMAIISKTQILDIQVGENTPLYLVPVVIGQGSKQLNIETTAQLNNPSHKIADTEVAIKNINTHIVTDKVIIQGILHSQIFYVGTDDIEYHQSEDMPFSFFIDMVGAEPGMDVDVKYVIENINYELESDTGFLQNAVILFSVIVTQDKQINLIKGTDEIVLAEEVQGEVLEQTVFYNSVKLEMPAQKIRNIEAQITSISADAIEDKVIIQGTTHDQIIYIGTDNIEYQQNTDINFSFFVDIEGINPGVNIRLFPDKINVIPELLNENELFITTVFELLIKVTNTVRFKGFYLF